MYGIYFNSIYVLNSTSQKAPCTSTSKTLVCCEDELVAVLLYALRKTRNVQICRTLEYMLHNLYRSLPFRGLTHIVALDSCPVSASIFVLSWPLPARHTELLLTASLTRKPKKPWAWYVAH
jgi:hypothetical protein